MGLVFLKLPTWFWRPGLVLLTYIILLSCSQISNPCLVPSNLLFPPFSGEWGFLAVPPEYGLLHLSLV